MNLETSLKTLPETSKNVVVVLSGGLDSTILTHLLVHRYTAEKVHALSFNYGQKQSVELELAAKTCNRLGISHKIIDIGFLGEISAPVCANIKGTNIDMPTIQDVLGDPQPSTAVPYRNMILNTVGFSYAECINASHVFSGLQSVDSYNYWDTSPEFVEKMNAVSSCNRAHNIQMVAPFSKMTKTEELLLCKELTEKCGADFVDLSTTLTCYNPDESGASCGVCPSCSERLHAFELAGLSDPVKYQ